MSLGVIAAEREVDSGLDGTEFPHSDSTSSLGVESRKTSAGSTYPNSDFKSNSETNVFRESRGSGKISAANSEANTRDEDIDYTTIRKDVGDESIGKNARPYFKTPLELEMEKKLCLLSSNGTLLKNIQKSELKQLAQAKANLDAELQTTRDVWKRLYFESKGKTIPLDEEVQLKKNELERYRDEILKRMKTRVVERSKQRNTSDALWRKRNLLQRRESRVNKHGRTQKISPLDEFSLKMEAMKMEKQKQKVESSRGRVDKTRLNVIEKTQENDLIKAQIEDLKRELEASRAEEENMAQ